MQTSRADSASVGSLRRKERAMTDKSNFSDEEWELVREGPPTAGMVAAAASSGGSFRESRALAKAFTEARKQHGESELLDALVSEKPHAKRHGSARGTRGAGHSASARRCHAARTEGDSGVEPILNPGGAPRGKPSRGSRAAHCARRAGIRTRQGCSRTGIRKSPARQKVIQRRRTTRGRDTARPPGLQPHVTLTK
jgi:hypothetical protein